MGENLKTTRLDDGVPHNFVPDKTTWQNLSGQGYCWQENNSANKTTYGALYNWSAVNTGNLCPAWRQGIDYLSTGISRLSDSGKYGLSVRCLKD